MTRTVALLLVAALLTGCGSKLKRLTSVEQDHYTALKVFMDDGERKDFFKLKTQEERDAWLKQKGWWDTFYQYDPAVRGEILSGEVRVGWSHDKVLMAWGAPHTRTRLAGRAASRSEQLTYRFEVAEDGTPYVWSPNSNLTHRAIELYRVELIEDDGVVRELNRRDGWQ